MLTCVHDNMGHLRRYLGDHTGTNSLGKLFHRYLWRTTSDWLMHPTVENTRYTHYLTELATCSLGPNPDDTSTIFALLLSLAGVLFSLSSCPSDGEPLLCNVLAAEVDELSVLDAPVPFTLGPVCVERCAAEESKRHIFGFVTQSLTFINLTVRLPSTRQNT